MKAGGGTAGCSQMTEHLTNVQHELVSTQQLVDGKKKEVLRADSERHLRNYCTYMECMICCVYLRLQNDLRVVEFSKRFQMIS